MPDRPSYRRYEARRLGGYGNTWRGLAYMLRQAFTASTFGGFWRYWNPLFSYYLLYVCYQPLSRRLPRGLALGLTFGLSGAVHDFAASLIKGQVVFLFVPIFMLWGGMVVVEEAIGWHLRSWPHGARVLYHASLIVGTVWGVIHLSGI